MSLFDGKERRKEHEVRLRVAVRKAHDPLFALLKPAQVPASQENPANGATGQRPLPRRLS